MVAYVFQVGVIQTLCCYLVFFLVFDYYGIPASSLVGADSYFVQDADPFVVGLRVFSESEQLDILRQAQTGYFMMLTGSQVLHIFLAKTRFASVFHHGLFGNVVLLYGVVIEVILIMLLVFTPGVQDFFGTAAFPGRFWACVLLVWGVLLIFCEGKRWLYRVHGARIPHSEWLVW